MRTGDSKQEGMFSHVSNRKYLSSKMRTLLDFMVEAEAVREP